MMKNLKYICLMGILLSAGVAVAGDVNPVKAGQQIAKMAAKSAALPVLDVTTVPAHAVVAMEQEFLRLRSEREKELKQKIKNRISTEKNWDGTAQNSEDTEVDTEQSNVYMPADYVTQSIEKGIVPDSDKIKEDGQKSVEELSVKQQDHWTSSAGTLETKTAYDAARKKTEQEQAIRMMAEALVARKNLDESLKDIAKNSGENYDMSEAAKNLDNKKGTVSAKSDYNHALRQYAMSALVYDQLLSVEQQIVGLRLQARAGKYAQGLEPISDRLTEQDKKEMETGQK